MLRAYGCGFAAGVQHPTAAFPGDRPDAAGSGGTVGKIERTALSATAERAHRDGGNGQSRYNRAHPENDSHDCP